MKAIVLKGFGGTDKFWLEELPTPAVDNTGMVLVKIRATAFNPIDFQMRRGDAESKRMKSPILGREFSGVVVKKSDDVTGFEIGEAVYAASGSMGSNGTYAEYITLPQEAIARMPRNISFPQAAALPVASVTALQIIHRLNIPPADSVLVTGGAGGVGLLLVKLLLAKGIHRLVVTAGSEESIRQLVAAGCNSKQIVSYRSKEPAAAVLAANDQQSFDYCIDLVGGTMSELCSEVISIHGIYADVTTYTTATARERLFNKGCTQVNISNYAYQLKNDRQYNAARLNEITALIEAGTITPTPVFNVGTLSVEAVQQAHQILETNQTKGRKVIMEVE